MSRRLLNLLTLLSLRMFVVVAAIWLRSYVAWDLMHVRTTGRWFHGGWACGNLRAGTWLTAENDPPEFTPVRWRALPTIRARELLTGYEAGASYRLNALGFQYLALGNSRAASHRMVIVPIWAVALATAVMPTWRLHQRRRLRLRSATGLCLTCGYDLRGTPHRCPECGATAAVPATR